MEGLPFCGQAYYRTDWLPVGVTKWTAIPDQTVFRDISRWSCLAAVRVGLLNSVHMKNLTGDYYISGQNIEDRVMFGGYNPIIRVTTYPLPHEFFEHRWKIPT